MSRGTDAYFVDIPDVKVPKEMLGVAVHILEIKVGDFEPEKFEGTYQNAVVALIRAKRAGLPEKSPARFVEPARSIITS